jgi:hypothetical protein
MEAVYAVNKQPKFQADTGESEIITSRLQSNMSVTAINGDDAAPEAITVYGEKTNVPVGTFRSKLCECCVCPICLVAWICPFIIWAQVHYSLNGGSTAKPSKGLRGYLAIVGGFALLYFVAGCLATTTGGQLAWFITCAGGLVALSLFKRMRVLYQIQGEGACNDCFRVVCCLPCVTFQMGNHLFDYRKHPDITYEPVPTEFAV